MGKPIVVENKFKLDRGRMDDFFAWAEAREDIRIRKEEAGASWPWTQDELFQKFHFNNVFRDDDWTSRVFRNCFYRGHEEAPREQILLNALLARYFGAVNLPMRVGWLPTWNETVRQEVDLEARNILGRDVWLWTPAYRLAGDRGFGDKIQNVLNVLDNYWNLRGDILAAVFDPSAAMEEEHLTWYAAARELRWVRGLGTRGFMTGQILLDACWTHFWRTDSGGWLPRDFDKWVPLSALARECCNWVCGRDPKDPLKKPENIAILRDIHEDWRQSASFGGSTIRLYDTMFALGNWFRYVRFREGWTKYGRRYFPPGTNKRLDYDKKRGAGR